jgi:hypothetical protein
LWAMDCFASLAMTAEILAAHTGAPDFTSL